MLSILLVIYIVLGGLVTMALIAAVIMSGLTNSAAGTETGVKTTGREQKPEDFVPELPEAPCKSHSSAPPDISRTEKEEYLSEVESVYKRVQVF
jgi:hypothetical protein